jgi:HEAT repeat protein
MIHRVTFTVFLAFLPVALSGQEKAGFPVRDARTEAMKALTQIVEENATRHAQETNAAVQALGGSGQEEAIPILWDYFKSCENTRGKTLALKAIGQLGDREQIDRLKDVFEGVDDPRTRADLREIQPSVAAGIALLTLEDRSGIIEMNNYLKGRDRELQKRALLAFAHAGEDSSKHLMAELLESSDTLVRSAAVEALVQVSEPGDPFVIAKLQPLLEERTKEIRLSAARALAVLGDKSGKDILEEQLKRDRYQPDLLGILYSFGDRKKLAELVALLSDELSDTERSNVEAILINIGKSPALVDALIGILEGENVSAIVSAAVVLGDLGETKAVEGLIALLDNEDEGVQEAAVNSLGRIGAERALPALKELKSELDEAAPYETRRISSEVAVALGNLGDESGAKHFLIEKRKPGREYTEVDGVGLAKITHRSVIPTLMKVLKYPEYEIERGTIDIIEALEAFEAREALPMFVTMLDELRQSSDIEELTRLQAVKVIEFIGRFGSASHVKSIESLLSHRDVRIRLASAIAILALLQEEESTSNE